MQKSPKQKWGWWLLVGAYLYNLHPSFVMKHCVISELKNNRFLNFVRQKASENNCK